MYGFTVNVELYSPRIKMHLYQNQEIKKNVSRTPYCCIHMTFFIYVFFYCYADKKSNKVIAVSQLQMV